MTPRDAALLPRLLLALDTLENDAEILQAVHQVRRILKGKGTSLSKLAENIASDDAPKIAMADDRHDVRVRLRDLGMMLRFAQHPDQVTNQALQAARQGMVDGTPVAGEDMRALLACMRDLLKARAFDVAARASGANGPHTDGSLREAMEGLRESVDEMERARGYFAQAEINRARDLNMRGHFNPSDPFSKRGR
jgi:hypothetical protein